jgi:transcriptional regulator with XRE-family HTH domain
LRVANDTANRLLARIRELRLARGLTQETFAERAGLGYKHYQQVEAGRKSDLRLSTLIKMAAGLGLKLHELVDFELAPPAVAEDPGKYGTKPTARKSVRKSTAR